MKLNQTHHLNRQPGILWRFLVFYYKITNEFLRVTILNGLKYLTFKYLTVWEKLFFLCCFIAALYNSINFAMNVVEKWQTSPVMTSMNPKTSLITKEPFPAITICNMNKVQYSKVKDFDVKSLDYAMLQKLCFQELNYTKFQYKEPQHKIISFSKFIAENTQPCSDMITFCEFGNLEITCSDLFRDVLLDDGMCCSFNIVHPQIMYKGDYFMVRDYTSVDGPLIPIDWTPEKGYPKDLPTHFYPRMALGDGLSNGLKIVLNGDFDNHYCLSTNGPGFKVAVHNPIYTPDIKENGLSVPFGYQTTFRISSVKEVADETLQKSTKPKQRQCYFSEEYSLQYFNYYTKRNCEMECDAQFMLRKCNCLQYFMPLVSHNATECHVRHFDCVNEAEMDYSDPILIKCKKACLPNCNTLSYSLKAFSVQLSNAGFAINSHQYRNVSKESLNDYTVLQIFFPYKYYSGYVKYPYIGFTELVSQVGGIMSLMTGFSIISLVELVYFFIIKPLIYAWRKIFYKNIVGILGNN